MSSPSPAETEEQFRARARQWLAEHAPPATDTSERHRMVDHRVSWAGIEEQRRWQRLLAGAGFGALTWPTAWGGAGLPTIYDIAFQDEARAFATPPAKTFAPAIGQFGPVLMKFGTAEQQAKHLHSMLHGDEIWCQLFSEPEAGSDLAAARTTIVRDGDELVLNGQKIWSSRAQYSDFGFLIGRSDRDLPKHAGLSCVIVDMKAAGVDARPIKQMDGGTSFTEVFFTDVRLPASTLVGGWNDGWTVARYTLMHERFGMASRGRNASIAALQELARARGLDDDPVIRDKLVKLYVRVQLLRFLGLRLESAARRQVAPGPEGSVAKLLFGEIFDGSVELAMELLGPWGMLARGSAGAEEPTDDPYGFWQAQLLGAPSAHIAGGSDQILRNIIGERILGLPRDPRPEGATGSRSAS